MYYKNRETKEPTVFCVFYNSDFTEGRGPFVLDSVWISYEEAAKYIDNKPGIQGVKQKWSSLNSEYNDWYIKELPLIRNLEIKTAIDNAIIREQALKKLTAEERKILGL